MVGLFTTTSVAFQLAPNEIISTVKRPLLDFSTHMNSGKMSTRLLFRAVVNERLTAAAEEIFQVFESTIAKYEEEASSSKQEIERLRGLLLESVANHKTGLLSFYFHRSLSDYTRTIKPKCHLEEINGNSCIYLIFRYLLLYLQAASLAGGRTLTLLFNRIIMTF